MGDIVKVITSINRELHKTRLPDEDGNEVWHLTHKMPFFISDRSFVVTIYKETLEDGSQINILSSQGNEEIIKRNKKLIGSDVVANGIIAYTKAEFFDGGINLT